MGCIVEFRITELEAKTRNESIPTIDPLDAFDADLQDDPTAADSFVLIDESCAADIQQTFRLKDIPLGPSTTEEEAHTAYTLKDLIEFPAIEVKPLQLPLIQLEGDRVSTLPSLDFSSSSGLSSCQDLVGLSFDGPSSPSFKDSAGAGNLSHELEALREALASILIPNLAQHTESILAILLMLPKKQRLRCFLSSDYFYAKAKAALDLLLVDSV